MTVDWFDYLLIVDWLLIGCCVTVDSQSLNCRSTVDYLESIRLRVDDYDNKEVFQFTGGPKVSAKGTVGSTPRLDCNHADKNDGTPMVATEMLASHLWSRRKCWHRIYGCDGNAGIASMIAMEMLAAHLLSRRKCWHRTYGHDGSAGIAPMGATEMLASHLWSRWKCWQRTNGRDGNAGIAPMVAVEMLASHLWL